MPGLLGKRKSPSTEEESDAAVDAQELLRRHFEARFKPLDIASHATPAKATANNDSRSSDGNDSHDVLDCEADGDGSDSEWDGISDDGNSTEGGEGLCI